jgi:hypothetical protein
MNPSEPAAMASQTGAPTGSLTRTPVLVRGRASLRARRNGAHVHVEPANEHDELAQRLVVTTHLPESVRRR